MPKQDASPQILGAALLATYLCVVAPEPAFLALFTLAALARPVLWRPARSLPRLGRARGGIALAAIF